jgi:site-specific DNA-methyltransferase (adenine-specific)
MDEASVDAIVCDPPYGLNFMGKEFDKLGEAKAQQLWHERWTREALRVLKPGGHLLAFGGTRTYHRMTCAIEDAGFEIRDCIQWIYGSGFPKSKSMRGIDRPELGTALKPAHEPIVMARKPLAESSVARQVLKTGTGALNIDASRISDTIATPVGPDGEIKDLPGGRWPANLWLSHVGGPEGCRPTGEMKRVKGLKPHVYKSADNPNQVYSDGVGKWEAGDVRIGHANPDGTEEVAEWRCVEGCPVRLMDEQSGNRPTSHRTTRKTGEESETFGWKSSSNEGFSDKGGASRFFKTFGGTDGGNDGKGSMVSTGCSCGWDSNSSATDIDSLLSSQQFHPDTHPGFQYVAKASRAERNKGLEGMPVEDVKQERYRLVANKHRENGRNQTQAAANNHPTVKPLALMRYLTRLICPPGGTVLDPFCGSGSTGCGAVQEGFNFIGIEAESEYCEIARRRIAYWSSEAIPEENGKAESPERLAQEALPLEIT